MPGRCVEPPVSTFPSIAPMISRGLQWPPCSILVRPPCNRHATALSLAGEGGDTWRRHDEPAPAVRFEWRAEGVEEAFSQVGHRRHVYVSPPHVSPPRDPTAPPPRRSW